MLDWVHGLNAGPMISSLSLRLEWVHGKRSSRCNGLRLGRDSVLVDLHPLGSLGPVAIDVVGSCVGIRTCARTLWGTDISWRVTRDNELFTLVMTPLMASTDNGPPTVPLNPLGRPSPRFPSSHLNPLHPTSL
jgi:hypothetical protein